MRIEQITLPPNHSPEDLTKKISKFLGVGADEINNLRIIKKSIDARKKPDIFFIYSVDITLNSKSGGSLAEYEDKIIARAMSKRVNKSVNIVKSAPESAYKFEPKQGLFSGKNPVVAGSGPAGLFCAYMLSKYGYAPIVIERGESVENRMKTVNKFWESGELNLDSNVQFGEGGAGSFSDGKLTTGVKDRDGRLSEALRIFVEAGAPECILYEHMPHIGTDILIDVIRRMRNEIIARGGEVRFNTKLSDIHIEQGRITGIDVTRGNEKDFIETETLVLAIGHSARDTFEMLYKRGVPMEEKPFAVGFRVEHAQEFINRAQYGNSPYFNDLPPSPYKLAMKTPSGRNVYSFCMCPGGYVINASSEDGRLAINGMSYNNRGGKNANSAIVINVTNSDFRELTGISGDVSHDPLIGMKFQRIIEERAYNAGGGRIPINYYGNVKQKIQEKSVVKLPENIEGGRFTPMTKGGYIFTDIHNILTRSVNEAFVCGMERFGNIIKGFADDGTIVSGIESRTSSPVRITRDESLQSAVRGLYPCGEGAGYAGGIMSAAIDGIKAAERILGRTTKNFTSSYNN